MEKRRNYSLEEALKKKLKTILLTTEENFKVISGDLYINNQYFERADETFISIVPASGVIWLEDNYRDKAMAPNEDHRTKSIGILENIDSYDLNRVVTYWRLPDWTEALNALRSIIKFN